jgi:tetratricopeptide (TPR) repeat protein
MRHLLAYIALVFICAGSAAIASGQTPAPPAAAASPAAANPSFQELLDQLDALIASDFSGKMANSPAGRRILNLTKQLHGGITRAEYGDSRTTLEQLLDAIPTAPGKQIVTQLQQALLGEIESRNNELVAKVAAFLDKAARICPEAKRASDLDPLFADIDAIEIASGLDLAARERETLDSASQFLTHWQAYLAQSAGGYEAAALATLRSIRDSPTSRPLVPLTVLNAQIDILTQSEPAGRVTKILNGVKTLDDLPAAIEALRAISLLDPERFGSESTDGLAHMEFGARALKAGDYAAALATVAALPTNSALEDDYGRSFRSTSSAGQQYIAGIPPATYFSLRNQLLTALLPAYLALPENPQPKPGEDPSQYLLRLAGEAAARSDYGEVSQILGTYRLCAFNDSPPPWVDSGIAACTAYFQGQKLERAGFFAGAIAAYHRVLDQGPDQFNPVSQATARIAALRKDHPADFDKAVNGLPQPILPPSVNGR